MPKRLGSVDRAKSGTMAIMDPLGEVRRRAAALIAIAVTLPIAALLCLDACQEYDASLLHYSDAATTDVTDAASEVFDAPMDAPLARDGGQQGDASDASDASDALDAPAETDGPPPCSTTQADCDGVTSNGCETDLLSAFEHCGTCGHSCLGGDCLEGRCQPYELATGQSEPLLVALDINHVYWTNQGGAGAVMRTPKLGAAAEEIAVSDHPPGGIAVDLSAVYWSEFGSPGTVWRLDKADIGQNVAPTALATGQATSVALVEDGSDVYWTTPGTVRTTPKTGGPVTTLANGQGTPFGMVVELGQVYWSNALGGQIMHYNLLDPDAGAVEMATGQDYPIGLASDLGNLYWANYEGDADGGTPKLLTIAKVNMTQPVMLIDGQQGPAGVVVSGNELFWTNNVGGTVMKMPKLGGTPETIADNQWAPSGIAADATAVYWVNRDDGRVMAVAR
jgi:hypothetical protein